MVKWSHVTNWKLNISSSKRSVITKLCRVVTDDEGNSSIGVSWLYDHEDTWGHVTNKKQNFFLSPWLMATKLDRVVTYDEGNSPIMSDDPLITWSREVTWQIENLISSHLQGLWPPNMTSWELMVRGTPLWSHTILWQ